MKQKLTLTVEAGAVRKLKALAARRRTSVSALLEEWSGRETRTKPRERLGHRLKGRWVAHPAGSDPRLEFLLRKHRA